MSTPNEIELFFHCKQCLEELPPGMSPQEYGRNEVGWTNDGVQVWCKRHDINVVHLDFEGQQVSYKEDEETKH